MFTRINYAPAAFFSTVCLAFSWVTHATAILEIVPSSTTARSITIAATGSTVLIYSVTNNTQIPVNNLTIDPYYGMVNRYLSLTVQNNLCAGNLAPGASCTFGLAIQGSGQTINSVLMPRVCEFNGATCSVPIKSNRISVTAGGVGTSIAYVVNSAANGPVSICSVDTTNGSLQTCTTATGNGTFNYPQGIGIYPLGNIVYLANYGGTTLSICPVLSDGSGSFGTCTTSDGSGTFANPNGVALNPSGTFIYVSGDAGVSICPIINNGNELGGCTVSTGNGTFNDLQGVTVNADGTYAYVCNYDTVSICPILQDGSGLFGTCTTSTGNGTFNQPQGVSFSADNTTVYIGNFGNNTVSICPVLQDGSGGFGTCIISDGNGTFNFDVDDIVALFMSNPNNYGYIPNNGNNTVSVCSIEASTHSLGTCSVFSDASFNQPTAVALSYVIS